MDYLARFGLISSIAGSSSIDSEIGLAQNLVFDLFRLKNSVELNPRIAWVRLSLISERSIDYAGSSALPLPLSCNKS